MWRTVVLLVLFSCNISSRRAMTGPAGRSAYNNLIQETNNEQMLLNLVRLRYGDFPFFLDVASVTSQFSESTRASAMIPIPGFNNENPFTMGGELVWQNVPTIQYAPLEGADFIRHIMKPIDLVHVQQLIFSGWDIDRIFRLTIQNIDELSNARHGPFVDIPPKYRRFSRLCELLKYYQDIDELTVGVETSKKRPGNGSGSAESLEISVPLNNPNSEELMYLLPHGKKTKGHYVVRLNIEINQYNEIGILPRSVLTMMYYLAFGVEVPSDQVKQGWVNVTYKLDGTPFDWQEVLQGLMRIRHSKKRPPECFVSTFYKGYYFYIDIADIKSKRTFVLLLQLYNLQAIDAKSNAPLLTIPLR
ncbi:MAG: hypothetical protein ACOYL1_06485 [Chlamydiia bacterium]